MTQQDNSALQPPCDARGKLIWEVIEVLNGEAFLRNKQFDVGDVFFSLAFMSDDEINNIASLCGLIKKKAKASPPQEV